MRLLPIIFFFCPLILALGQEGSAPIEGIRSNDSRLHALMGGVVVSPRGDLKANIILRDGRIESVGENVMAPEGARVWDMEGKRIYPGFIEPWLEGEMSDKFTSSHWNKKVMPDRKAASLISIDEDKLKLMRGMGFCVAHAVPKDGIFRGKSALLLLRDGIRGEQLLNSSVGQVLDFDHGGGGYPSSLMGSIALVRQTLSDANWYHEAMAAHLKEPSKVLRPAHSRALDELELTDRFLFIARDELDYDRIKTVKNEFKLDIVIKGNGYEYRRISALKELGCNIIMPLNFPTLPSIDDPAKALDYSLEELQHWEFAPSGPALASTNGLNISFSSHGLDDPLKIFWKRVRIAVKRGMDPNYALQALTSIPAKTLGIDDRCGDLVPGKFANLAVSEGDLFLDDQSKIHTTWVDGIPYLKELSSESNVSGRWEISGFGDKKPIVWEIPESKNIKVEYGDGKDFSGEWKLGRLLLFPPSEIFGEKKGNARLSASFNSEEKTLSGVGVLTSGKTLWWNAKRIEGIKDKKKEEEKKSEIDDNVPHLEFSSYPAGAYGVKNLPLKLPERILFRGATIWTSAEQGIVKEADLLINKGRIVSIGKNLALPEGVKEINASGKHITPGLIDCHSHSAISRGVNEGTHAVTVEVRIGDSLDPTDISLYRQLAGGLTTANLLHGSANPMGGQNQVIKLRWGSDPDGLRFVGAKPGVKFALGENVKQSNWGDKNTTRYPQTRMGVEQIMKDTFIAASEYRKDKIKAAKENRPHRRNYRLEAVLEILDGERIVHIHSYRQDEILMFVRLAQKFGFVVGTFQHVLEGYKVADAIAEIGAGGSTFSDWWAYKFEVYDAIPYNASLMSRVGVVTSFNSDNSELACRMNIEAAKAVKYGEVSEEEALKFVTINPAKQLRIDSKVGSLEPGKDADFVIWNGHPLSTYSKAEQTWIEGMIYFDLETDSGLRKLAINERARLVNKVISQKIKDPEDDSKNDKSSNSKEETVQLSKRPRWLPVMLKSCTSVTRGLYHNGKSLHTCTNGKCCQSN
ncbi:MAG: amidohydrolase family protein [Verrucomicrobiota bacterium]|nr:amidohydrolase family protein [Verrucomicrobiota bacterium]